MWAKHMQNVKICSKKSKYSLFIIKQKKTLHNMLLKENDKPSFIGNSTLS